LSYQYFLDEIYDKEKSLTPAPNQYYDSYNTKSNLGCK